MSVAGQVLLVAPEGERAQRLDAVLAFIDIATTRLDPGDAVPAGEWNAVILLELPAAVTRSALLDQLAAACPGVPLLGVAGSGAEAGGAAPAALIGDLQWPPRHTDLIDQLQRARSYRDQFEQSRQRGAQPVLLRGLVGNSAGLRVVHRQLSQVAATDATVLILGESGTGKEVVARCLHEHSLRRAGPFVPVNCGAIPADLLESELFGHEKGAFTGAVSSRAGRFELARGGTLFLDEIGDMPLVMQVKLLRVLQERSFERVGGSQSLDADVRIVCATHKNIEEMIARGQFREDLYYRINVFPIEMPPLRERTGDLPLLVNELVGRLERAQRGTVRFNGSALESLRRHPWPGNVRELANLVERMAIMYPGQVVGVADLPVKFRHLEAGEETFELDVPAAPAEPAGSARNTPDSDPALLPVNGLDLKEYLQDLEKSLIEQALRDCNGVAARAADRLRLRRTTLVEKMRKYDLLKGGDAAED